MIKMLKNKIKKKINLKNKIKKLESDGLSYQTSDINHEIEITT